MLESLAIVQIKLRNREYSTNNVGSVEGKKYFSPMQNIEPVITWKILGDHTR